MILLVWPLWDMAGGHAEPLWLACVALAAVAAVHVAIVLTAFDGRVPMRIPISLVVAQTGLTSVVAVGFKGGWYSLFPLLGLATGVVVGHASRQARGPEASMLLGIGGVSAVCGLAGWVGGEDGTSILGNSYGTITAGLVTAVILRLFSAITLLRDAREELAEAAVTQERLRFSRDLHDLLGHTLSLMVVKAQAIRLVADRDPVLAAEQATDIETVGRRALGEVRQAVSGYRGRGLADELDAARTALCDAGVDATVLRDGPPLPAGPDALLGWAVREGVTNVIRHSGARRCEISVRNDGERVVLELKDDGVGPGGAVPDVNGSEYGAYGVRGGHGLRGLTERMAVADGTVEAGPAPGGGFLLAVTVPVTPSL
ncbi:MULTISPECIES: sensor histidine kinase [Actinomadura]|uniref:Sensor histidine kinase n=1 Tax=Actinomadura litoris TaxID=2678616 RepID=A0A7K1KUP8_9ACTN|nr:MULTISPECIES: sensor histidine kinase [Actinomadura]MBT2210988.1 sensor histidine kinase [Actinomadura sp. NEAU-AAG7]MUN35911.1 sensor histidine kinase [Actinomadura litoris]